MMNSLVFLLLSGLSLTKSCIAETFAFNSGEDLDSFVSEPLLRPPRFSVSHFGQRRSSPGYWFMAPYDQISQPTITTKLEACQIGPHIFDNDGNLVWSGACEFHNSVVFDFKAWGTGHSTGLSFILYERWQPGKPRVNYRAGVTMDRNLRRKNAFLRPRNEAFNMHEFTVIKGGKRGLALTGELRDVPAPQSLQFSNDTVKVWAGAIVEFDMVTGIKLWQWTPLDHVSVSESSAQPRPGEGVERGWDWFHPNSIDKNEDGDYLLSGRYTDTIYKVSGKDGSVIWRLGGRNSSFQLDGFNFSRQHDARFRGQNGNKTWVSLLNNAGDEAGTTGAVSAGYLIELDTIHMRATLLKQWLRPDGDRTRLRGNVQMLDNGHTFISWSENGYITEYDTDGKIVLDAQFLSHRLVTYRAYKFNFTGRPHYPPSLKSKSYDLAGNIITSIHVSWNGATDIASWEFYAGEDPRGANFTVIGRVQKTGFETALAVEGNHLFVYAEAIATDGERLGRSVVTRTVASTLLTQSGQLCTSHASATFSNATYSDDAELRAISLDAYSYWASLRPAWLYPLMTGLAMGLLVMYFLKPILHRVEQKV